MILLQKYEVGHEMEKKKRKPLVIGLWLMFIIMVAGIAFCPSKMVYRLRSWEAICCLALCRILIHSRQ